MTRRRALVWSAVVALAVVVVGIGGAVSSPVPAAAAFTGDYDVDALDFATPDGATKGHAVEQAQAVVSARDFLAKGTLRGVWTAAEAAELGALIDRL